MKVRTKIAGAVMAGLLTIGAGAGIAGAEPVPPGDRPTPTAECVAAVKKLRTELAVDARGHRTAAELRRARAWAVRHKRPAVVKRIDAALARLRAADAKLHAAIAAQRLVVKEACAPAA
jgi:hypothetical protein